MGVSRDRTPTHQNVMSEFLKLFVRQCGRCHLSDSIGGAGPNYYKQ